MFIGFSILFPPSFFSSLPLLDPPLLSPLTRVFVGLLWLCKSGPTKHGEESSSLFSSSFSFSQPLPLIMMMCALSLSSGQTLVAVVVVVVLIDFLNCRLCVPGTVPGTEREGGGRGRRGDLGHVRFSRLAHTHNTHTAAADGTLAHRARPQQPSVFKGYPPSRGRDFMQSNLGSVSARARGLYRVGLPPSLCCRRRRRGLEIYFMFSPPAMPARPTTDRCCWESEAEILQRPDLKGDKTRGKERHGCV